MAKYGAPEMNVEAGSSSQRGRLGSSMGWFADMVAAAVDGWGSWGVYGGGALLERLLRISIVLFYTV